MIVNMQVNGGRGPCCAPACASAIWSTTVDRSAVRVGSVRSALVQSLDPGRMARDGAAAGQDALEVVSVRARRENPAGTAPDPATKIEADERAGPVTRRDVGRPDP